MEAVKPCGLPEIEDRSAFLFHKLIMEQSPDKLNKILSSASRRLQNCGNGLKIEKKLFPTFDNSSTSKLAHKMDELDALENGISRETQMIENTNRYKNLKTIFKDFEPFNDDSPVYAAIKLLEGAAKKATG